MTLTLAALLVASAACVVNAACLVINIRQYNRLTGKWLPW